ncbi:MAG TPA: 4Fe-4S binding protein [Dehalococcoidales bacterium]|nr:4Fe-4S binding protein [Dehalococcoidales bacterium]
MLQVRKDLCLGCGLCAQNCPQQAISLLWGQAEIEPEQMQSLPSVPRGMPSGCHCRQSPGVRGRATSHARYPEAKGRRAGNKN